MRQKTGATICRPLNAYSMNKVLYEVITTRMTSRPITVTSHAVHGPLPAAPKAAIRDNDIGAMYLAGVNPYLLRAHCLGAAHSGGRSLAAFVRSPREGDDKWLSSWGVYAASHTPVMLNFPDGFPTRIARRSSALSRPWAGFCGAPSRDVIVVLSDDHLHNFFLNNFPALLHRRGRRISTPVEHWLKAEKQTLRGDGDLGAHLLGEALATASTRRSRWS